MTDLCILFIPFEHLIVDYLCACTNIGLQKRIFLAIKLYCILSVLLNCCDSICAVFLIISNVISYRVTLPL